MLFIYKLQIRLLMYFTGLALEALAGVISLASSEIDQSRVNTVKSDIFKLFDNIQKYDDGTFYFDEKFGGGREHQGSLSTSSSVVRGITSFAAVTSGKIDLITPHGHTFKPRQIRPIDKKQQYQIHKVIKPSESATSNANEKVPAASDKSKDVSKYRPIPGNLIFTIRCR
ncbi:hypothetical protein RYX36_030687 [Vicia faba]